jgi:signal transduction histidine kinase
MIAAFALIALVPRVMSARRDFRQGCHPALMTYIDAMNINDDPDVWFGRLKVGMWAVTGIAMFVEVNLNHREFLRSECLISWLIAFTACGASFWLTGWSSIRNGWPRAWTALLFVQAACIIFMIRWYYSVLGVVLLVFGAWQAAQVWSLRWSLTWSGLQTLGLGVVSVTHPQRLFWLLVTLVAGGLQLFAAIAAHLLRTETASRLALARANEELRAVQQLLARASRSAERLRVARELHDGLGHQLTALSLAIEAAGRQPPSAAEASIRRASGLVHEVLRELRTIVSRIREEEKFDLDAALSDVILDIERPRIHIDVDSSLGAIDAARGHTLVRCVQELVTNAVKHAGAAHLWIDIKRGSEGITLSARDDGRGAVDLREGNGLRGMRERVGLLGGSAIFSPDRTGFRATVHLPNVETAG